MTEKRYSRMTNHYGTSRTYCTAIYDNQNNRELKNASQVITELNALHEENKKLKEENKQLNHDLDLYEENNTNEVLNNLRIELTSRMNDCIEEFKE